MDVSQEQVKAEKAALDTKIAVLEAEVEAGFPTAVDNIDRLDFANQLWYMKGYSTILGDRIARF